MDAPAQDQPAQVAPTRASSPGDIHKSRLQHFEATPQPQEYRRRYTDHALHPLGVAQQLSASRPRKSLDGAELNAESFPDVVLHAMRTRGSRGNVAGATAETSDKGKRYAEMMERFQIRRVTRTPSNMSLAKTGTSRDLTDDVPLSIASYNEGADVGANRKSSQVAFTPPFPELAFRQDKRPLERQGIELDITALTPRDVGESSKTPRSSRSARFSIYWTVVSWQRRVLRTAEYASENILKPISPASVFSRFRLTVLLLAFAVHVVLFPLETAFFPDGPGLDVGEMVEVVVEIILMLDLLLMFNTAFYNKRNQLVTSRRDIARHYLRSWFLLDVVSSVPVDLILMLANDRSNNKKWLHLAYEVAFRSQRVIHIIRLARVMWTVVLDSPERSVFEWLLYSRYSHLVRIAWIIMFIVLIAHYLACGWRLLFASTPMRGTPIEEYVASFYDVLQLLQGQGVPTTTVTQNIYATVAILMGSIALAVIFGHVAILVSNFNANTTSYQRKMESVFAIMSKLRLPAPLRERIHQYYEHLWRKYESLDGEIVAFSKGLSHTLELEVVLYKYMDLIMHVPFWNDGSPDFQKQLMLSLQVRVYLPDDFIIRRGEVGDEFYMINRGVCELVLGPDSFECTIDPLEDNEDSSFFEVENDTEEEALPKTTRFDLSSTRQENSPRSFSPTRRGSRSNMYVLGGTTTSARVAAEPSSRYIQKLRRGQSFGEIALLMNYERTANVRALTYVEMCVLHRKDFQDILVKHPKDRKQVLLRMLSKTMENNAATKVWCPLKATVQAVFGEGGPDNDESISPMHAALLISNSVNLPLDDDSIKFGVGVRLREQLTELRDKQKENSKSTRRPSQTETEVIPPPRPTSEQAPAAPLAAASAVEVQRLAEQIKQLEHVQNHMASTTMELTHQIHQLRSTNQQLQTLVSAYEARLSELMGRDPPATMAQPSPLNAVPVQNMSRRLSRHSSLNVRKDFQPATIPKNKQRVAPLLRHRSISMSTLNLRVGDSSLKSPANAPQTQAVRAERLASTSIMQRFQTSSPLNVAGRVSANRISSTTQSNLGNETKRPSFNSRLLTPLKSLLASDPPTSQQVQSPTMYADQLFQSHHR